jgi:predicted RNA-binding Zn ribbon-like protein
MERSDDAAMLIGFLNTLHLPDDTDRLAGSTPDQWLADGRHDRGRSVDAPPWTGPDPENVAELRLLRAALRLLTRPSFEVGAEQSRLIPDADRVLASVPMRLALRHGRPGTTAMPALVPADSASGYAAQVTAVATALVCSRADGSFARIKTCARPACQWAFYDTSKNRSRRWCSMASCGNLSNNRDYRARRRPPMSAHAT